MNNLEKYLDQVIEQKPVVYESPPEPQEEAPPNIMKAVLRRWHITLLVFIVICAAGLPAVWFLIEPRYVVTGTIHVAPVKQSILTGQADRGEILEYDNYVNTLVWRILHDGLILNDVAGDLDDRNLSFFKAQPSGLVARLKQKLGAGRGTRDEVEVLRSAIADGTISAGPIRRSENIAVTMKSTNQKEAKQIVDSFLRNFDNRYGITSTQQDNATLTELNTQRDRLSTSIGEYHNSILNLAETYGDTDLDSRQEMEMQRQTTLMTELIRLEAQRIALEARIDGLRQAPDGNTPPEQLMTAGKEYVNSDPMVEELTKNIIDMERSLMIAKQTLAPGNPELERKQELLDVFTKRLEETKKNLTESYTKEMSGRIRAASKQRLAAAEAELAQIKAHETKLGDSLPEQEETTKQIGIDKVALQDLQFKMRVEQELQAQVVHRIRALEMESRRGTRITIELAQLAGIEDKRVKFSAGIVFVALGCGLGLAFLRDKMDKTLQTPDDLTRHLDLPVIGTTTSSHAVKAALFAEQIAGDYQTIRTNLGLLTSGGMPGKLAVSSAGVREGKTTFAVNLATSLAKSGKKVLLIDGDLRKPDIGCMLSISNGSAGLQDVLLGEDPIGIIRAIPSSGLHVLLANPRNLGDAYELLTSTAAAEQIEKLGRQYDHVIIDTPPALVFPDALVWAKLTDAVILVGFAGQTTAPDLREAKERFARIRARVLGAVLSNVSVDHGLYRYGYSYRTQESQGPRRARAAKKLLLPTHSDDGDATSKKV